MPGHSVTVGLRASPADPEVLVLGQPYWWQWPTILSLDAPVVAVFWQWLLAHVVSAAFGWSYPFVLGASVWLAYAADRWIEGWRLVPDDIKTQRHHFAQRHRWPLVAIWTLVLVADVTVALFTLAPRQLGAGAGLSALVLIYLVSHQFLHRHHPWRLPKELCIAGLLMGGVALFLVTPGDAAALAGPVAMFGLLCFSNCALISAWERDVDAIHGETSLTLQFRHGGPLSRWLPWCVAAIAAVAFSAALTAGS